MQRQTAKPPPPARRPQTCSNAKPKAGASRRKFWQMGSSTCCRPKFKTSGRRRTVAWLKHRWERKPGEKALRSWRRALMEIGNVQMRSRSRDVAVSAVFALALPASPADLPSAFGPCAIAPPTPSHLRTKARARRKAVNSETHRDDGQREGISGKRAC